MKQEKPAPRKARVIKFGAITVAKDGQFIFSDFRIDGEGEFTNPVETILTLVIERLQTELHEYQNRKVDKVGRYAAKN